MGGGNSACDLSVELSRLGGKPALSVRRGYHIIPRWLLGRPSDQQLSRFRCLPTWLIRAGLGTLLRLGQGDLRNYGLPRPDHPVLASHPVVNSELLPRLKRGKIRAKGAIAKVAGKDVHFQNGDVETFDVIIAATGYRIEFPFLDRSLTEISGGRLSLFRRVFHPERRDLFFIGLIQPLGSIWPLSDLQSKVVANFIQGRVTLPFALEGLAAREDRRRARQFIDSPRHHIEVDYYRYRRELLAMIPPTAPSWNPEGMS